jgi:CheY-like chemotaxis protein
VLQVEDTGRALYSISAVGNMVGLPVATLRTWEDRYALVVPDRNAHRLLAEQLGAGLPITTQTSRGRLLILLVEPDPYSAEYQEYFLKTEGFEVKMASDEEAARRSLHEDPPSLAVIELLVSGGSGLSLCRYAKEAGVPVVAVSVLECRDQAIEAGADAFLLKPLDPLKFVSTARDLLGSSSFLHTPPGDSP